MKNNRSLADHDRIIKKHGLSIRPPLPDSLFWKMWNGGGKQIAQQALNTDYVRGIQAGNLDPITYGAFNVNDIFYCFNGADDYGDAGLRTTNPVLKDYLKNKRESYNKYNESSCAALNLNGPMSVVPTSTVLKYSEYERSVAKGTAKQGAVKDPIFTLIVMLPCEYLWSWIAEQLAPPRTGNIYAKWITSNNDPSGAYAMGNFLQDYIDITPIDEDLALAIYLRAMEYEYRNFFSATHHDK